MRANILENGKYVYSRMISADQHIHDFSAGAKTALITGAARRMGKAMAQHLAASGWNIAIHYHHSEKDASSLMESLSHQYPAQKFLIFKADLAKNGEVSGLLTTVISTMGKPQLLINNASVFEPATISGTSGDFFDYIFSVNFKTPFLLIRDYFIQCGTGNIINVVDTRITSHKTNFAAYTLTKKMLWELTKMAAVEFGPAVRVNAIAPGLTLPPEGKNLSYLEELARNIPMKRPGGIEPILKALDYILGNDYLTGQLLFCDGGENLA